MPADRPTKLPFQIPVTLATRAHFVWSTFWAIIMTVTHAIAYVITGYFRPTAEHFTYWASAWGRAMFFFAGIRIEVTGAEHIDRSGPYVLVANHQNGLDIPAVAIGLPVAFGFVAKADLKQTPFIGLALRRSPSVFVDPTHPRRSLESIRIAGARIREGSSVLVFPEGARSYDGRLRPFRRGAFLLAVEAGVPMVPVTIVDATNVFNERKWACRPGTVRIVIGRPIETADLHRRDATTLMKQAFDAIVKPLPEPFWNPPVDVQ